ncbi:hypothetical protein J7T55_012301 [Diaporthe amygdali]|uniref:uncharacterized protein n=1 Tax=Phomopsis amygdali TaxID=1214568 RepID=UPI0022FF0A25|nr:uncharacterized protein J7T55_012301 [Diaporthe amygdali]KAJ0123831.1 hypothetical protein J7T55_012301 [Diaporthe amygdali]
MNMTIQEDDQPHSSSTHACYTTEFNSFVRSRIRVLHTLREYMGHANLVAMDTEHGSGVSSIGLAFASELEPFEHPIHPAAMTDVGCPEGGASLARSICFNIRGFERSQPTRERVWGQADEDIDIQDVASKVIDTVRGFKEIEPEKPLILVTYSSRAELSAISTLMPQLHPLFSNWVDVQPIVRDAYHSHTNYTRLDGLQISLRYAMRSLGFPAGYQPADLHHAGNDALRALAIMACLTHENVQFRRIKELEHVLRVNKYRKEQNRLKGTERSRGLLSKRPGPPSRYPHVAKITMVPAPHIGQEGRAGQSLADAMKATDDEGQLHLPPVDFCKPPQVWDFFSPYEPSAIGRVCRENCYYVCVTSPGILQNLIEDLDRTSACPAGQAVLVEDVSDLRALGTAKREERAKHRQESEGIDPAYIPTVSASPGSV